MVPDRTGPRDPMYGPALTKLKYDLPAVAASCANAFSTQCRHSNKVLRNMLLLIALALLLQGTAAQFTAWRDGRASHYGYEAFSDDLPCCCSCCCTLLITKHSAPCSAVTTTRQFTKAAVATDGLTKAC